MKLVIAKNKKKGDIKAFEVIKKQIIKKPDSLIGFAVGKTTDGLYKLISKDAKKNASVWKRVKLFQIDEKIGISSNSANSFNFEIRKELKDLLKIIKKENVFLIDGIKNPKKTIKEAYSFIRRNKGIDLIILGIGPEYDPHIAYNTTSKSSINSRMRVVKLHPKTVQETYRRFGVPAAFGEPRLRRAFRRIRGITLGIKDILECKKALLIAYGKEKAKSIKLAFSGKVNMKKASASALLLHKDLCVVIDKRAVS